MSTYIQYDQLYGHIPLQSPPVPPPSCVVFTDFLLCNTSDMHVLLKVSSPLCPFRKPCKIGLEERYYRPVGERQRQEVRQKYRAVVNIKRVREKS